jgi:hypothetical protein
MYSSTKLLTSQDVTLLTKDVQNLDMAKNFCKIILPILIVLCGLSWYFSFYGVIIFLSTGLSILCSIFLLVSIIQGNNIRKDLQGNTKIIEKFLLKKKRIMNNKKRQVILQEDYLERIAEYKTARDKELKPSFMTRKDHYEETLRYSFLFDVVDIENKNKEFMIPIEYFIKFKDGDNITIEYGEYSKKVLNLY